MHKPTYPILLHKVSIMKLLHCNSSMIVYHPQDLTFPVAQICRYIILLAGNRHNTVIFLQVLLTSIMFFNNIPNCVLIDRNIQMFLHDGPNSFLKNEIHDTNSRYTVLFIYYILEYPQCLQWSECKSTSKISIQKNSNV